MTSLVFIADDSTQSTSTSISGASTYIPVYALTTNLNNLSTNSTLSINNLIATSNTIFTNLNSLSTNSTLSINNLNSTSNTIFTNLNSLSTNSTLSINNLNATSNTIFNNLNSLSTNSTLSINNLNATSTSLLNKTNFTNLLVSGASTINSSLNISGITTLSNKTIINGVCNIHGGNPLAVLNNQMQKGSLTIGDMSLDYGGGSNWSTNTSGLMLECLNNTEIAVHDAGNRLASLMYYEGASNKITIGRDWSPWGAISNIILNGNVGIGTSSTSAKLHIEHSSTTTTPSQGGLYVYNPNNAITNSSVICTRIAGSVANKALYSLDVNMNYGWSMYINGNDTVNKLLRFNASWDGTGTDRLTIAYDGSTVINGSLNVSGNIIGSGTALSNLNYGSIINKPDLTQYDAWTKVSGTTNIYNTGSYGKVGINTSTPQAALEVIGYNNSYRMKWGTTLSNGTAYGANRIYSNGLFRFLSTNYTDEIATFHRIDNYDDPLNATEYFSIKTTGINVTGDINASGNLYVSGLTILNNATTCSSSLYVSGLTILNNSTTINGILSLKNDVWHQSNDNIYRLYYANNSTTYICSGGAAADNGLVVYSSLASGGYTTNLAIKNNGDTSIRGSLTSSGTIYANGDKLNFPNTLNQYKINLWGTNNYGFGIDGGTLMYSSSNYHKFYNSNNNVNTFTIDSVGSVYCPGTITSSNTIRGTKFVCAYGETIAYTSNWNSTGKSGWFIVLNDFWSGNNGNTGCSYLTIAFNLVTTTQFCCFCCAHVYAGGGANFISIDSKNPTSGSYEFFVTNEWDGGGVNALRIRTGVPGSIVENLRYKIYG